MTAVGFIPARMASTRFPGKPLTPIAGRPMLAHCVDGARRSALLDEVVVCTCDDEIAEWAAGYGVRCEMTADTHERASDRIAEANERVGASVALLIQGDEPLVGPEMVDAALRPVLDGETACANLIRRIPTEEEFLSPNFVKVVADLEGNALYLSRSPLPSTQYESFADRPRFHQLGIIAFTAERLAEFAALEPTPLEIAESCDMLRFVEHGRAIRFVETTAPTQPVDVPADVALVERLLTA